MSNPLVHAERSARKWGGSAHGYLALHQWLDANKGHLTDNRHRMLLHNSFRILLAEQVFGSSLTNGAGQRVFVRDLAARHTLEDLGFIPIVAQCLEELPSRPWMAGGHRVNVPVAVLSFCSHRSLTGVPDA